jgi:outer membrane scaffolding protein for murein synthesis (MipA/OmpV family)
MKRIQILIACGMILLAAQAANAQQNGWEFSVGGGVAGEYVYLGSDDYYVAALPSFNASYTHENVNYYLSLLDGLGVTYMNPGWGLMMDVNLNAGSYRDPDEYNVVGVPVKHSADTKRLLADTPSLDTPLALTLMLATTTQIGMFGASVAIHPTSVEYPRAGLEDETRTGLIYSALYNLDIPISQQLSLSALFSLDFMDETYADTWFTVDQPTPALEKFEADAGLHSSMIMLEINYQISERVSLSAVGGSTILMGDAKDSPFTVETVQRQVMVQMLYHF